MRPITTVRAGMLTPSASVSVAKTTCIRPLPNSDSTICFRIGSKPAWWNPIPTRASRVINWTWSKLAILGPQRIHVSLDDFPDPALLGSADEVRTHLRKSLGI